MSDPESLGGKRTLTYQELFESENHRNDHIITDKIVDCIRERQTYLKDKQEAQGETETKIYKLVHSPVFQTIMVGVIMVNAVMMAVQTDVGSSWRKQVFGHEIDIFLLLNTIFLTIFTVEIGLRLAASGVELFFIDPDDWAWNVFDFSIVAFGVCDQVFFHLGPWLANKNAGADHHHAHRSGNCQAMMAARMLRILRVLRVVRVFRAFRKLRMLAQGLIESIGIVFWIFVLTVLLIFLCAILTTTLIGQNADLWEPEDRPEIREMWGSVSQSMFTLFQFLTLDGWQEAYLKITEKMPLMTLFFFPFIFFGAFVIMSLLTGVMADHMNDVRNDTEEEELRDRLMRSDLADDAVKEHDLNGDGELGLQEFVEVFEKDKPLPKTLKELGVTVTKRDALELFEWFDMSCDGSVGTEELRNGCKALITGLTPLQLFRFGATIRDAADFVNECLANPRVEPPWASMSPAPSPERLEELLQLERQVDDTDRKIAQFERSVRNLMEKCGWDQEARSPQMSPRDEIDVREAVSSGSESGD